MCKKIISGKVREVYEADEKSLVIVTTDRISAFDVILSSEVPGKGIALNRISNFWFDYTKKLIPNHMLTTDVSKMPELFSGEPEKYQNRTIQVKKLKMLPYEIIVRGYMFGSMWEAYKSGKPFCGNVIEGEYKQAEKLAVPIVTPSTKSSEGHDIYISREELAAEIGAEMANKICDVSLELYNTCYKYAAEHGIIIADTKFEFGLDENGTLVLADEIFTPDSSRFWDAAEYRVGESPKSFDKQFVRDWLIANKLNGVTPAPVLPAEVVEKTAELYRECTRKLGA